MPATDGITATRQLTAPGRARPPRIIILTTYDLDEYVFDALARRRIRLPAQRRAAGRPPSQAIRHVAAGDALLAPRITRL